MERILNLGVHGDVDLRRVQHVSVLDHFRPVSSHEDKVNPPKGYEITLVSSVVVKVLEKNYPREQFMFHWRRYATWQETGVITGKSA